MSSEIVYPKNSSLTAFCQNFLAVTATGQLIIHFAVYACKELETGYDFELLSYAFFNYDQLCQKYFVMYSELQQNQKKIYLTV